MSTLTLFPRSRAALSGADAPTCSRIRGDGIHTVSLGGSTAYRLNPFRHEEAGRRHIAEPCDVSFLVSRANDGAAARAAAAASYAEDRVFQLDSVPAQGTHPSAGHLAQFVQRADDLIAKESRLLRLAVPYATLTPSLVRVL